MLAAPRWKLTVPLLALGVVSLAFWPERDGEAAPRRAAATLAKSAEIRKPIGESHAKPGTVASSNERDAKSPADAGNRPPPAPDPLPERATVRRVQAKLDELAKWVRRKKGTISAAAIAVDSGKLLAGVGERTALNPASNAKLITAAVALDRLGPNFRYNTGVYGRIRDGRAERLVLRGHGDPSLTLAQLWDMAFTLSEMGLKRVGAVEVDGSRFDKSFVPPAFDQQPNEWAAFRAPVSAVAIERNTVTLNVVPGEAGESARSWVDPPGFVEIQGMITTKAKGTGQAVRLTLSPSGSKLVAKIGGHVPEGSARLRFTRRVDDPALFAGYVFRHCLQKLGIKVEQEVRRGTGVEKHRLVYTASSPLRDMLDELGKDSDNFYAEMLFKTLGAEFIQEPARSRDGASVAIEWLKELGAYPRGSRVTNGSGLFDANLMSALSLVKVLDAVHKNPAVCPEFLAHLAISGTDGTLRSRLRAKSVRGRVRAKTGTLARVDALSGYVMAPHGRSVVAFSFLVNGVAEHWETRPRLDAVVAALTRHVWR